MSIAFLEPFVVDPQILNPHPNSSATDLTKRVHEVFVIMHEDPTHVTPQHLKAILQEPNAQINKFDSFYAHCMRSATLARRLTEQILDKDPSQKIHSPDVMYALGLMHDLSAAYTRYGGEYAQYDKELTLFFHADYFDVTLLAEAGMHSTYLEILDNIMYLRTPKHVTNLYEGWRRELSPQYPGIKKRFRKHVEGDDNLSLMVLSVVDHIDDKSSPNGELDLDARFLTRSADLVHRYYTKQLIQGLDPTPYGTALVEGMPRMHRYKDKIKDLIS